MNIADGTHKAHEAYERQMRLFTAKSHDYAGNADTLANGKAMARACQALRLGELLQAGAPDAAYLYMLIHKVQRWCNLRLQSEPPKCETIQDTTDDAANYLRLAALALAEQEASDGKGQVG